MTRNCAQPSAAWSSTARRQKEADRFLVLLDKHLVSRATPICATTTIRPPTKLCGIFCRVRYSCKISSKATGGKRPEAARLLAVFLDSCPRDSLAAWVWKPQGFIVLLGGFWGGFGGGGWGGTSGPRNYTTCLLRPLRPPWPQSLETVALAGVGLGGLVVVGLPCSDIIGGLGFFGFGDFGFGGVGFWVWEKRNTSRSFWNPNVLLESHDRVRLR